MCKHAKVKFASILIFLNLLLTELITGNICPDIDGKLNNVTWSSTDTKTLSKPPCVDKNKELLYRSCISGKWDLEPQCYHIQAERTPNCPDGFTNLEGFCYILIETTFPPKCPSNSVVNFDYWIKYVTEKHPNVSFWMPVTRDLNYGFFKWIEPSSLYGTEYENKNSLKILELDKDKNCLTYQNGITVAVSCNEKHVGVCFYETDKWLSSINNLCTKMDCVQNNFFDASKCICSGTTSDKKFVKKAEFFDLIQNSVPIYVSREKACTFGLEKLNGKYIWSHFKQEIDYTFWSKEAVFGDTLNYGAATPNGWILTEQPLDCTLFETELEILEPRLELDYSNTTYIFKLKLVNPNFFATFGNSKVFCFTDYEPLDLVYRYETLTVGEDPDTLLFEHNTNTINIRRGAGYHWCEAFKLPDTTVIKSNIVRTIPSEKYYEFVMMWKVLSDDNTDAADVIDTLKNIFSKVEQQYEATNALKLMKMFDFNIIEQSLFVNIHATIYKIEYSESSTAKKFQTVVESVLNQEISVIFVNILSAEICFEETDNDLSWPATPLKQEATSNEFCFTKDAARVVRVCEGDNLNGASWSTYDDCLILDYSSITDQLIPLYMSAPNKVDTNTLLSIARLYNKFDVFDVYIIGQVYEKLFFSDYVEELIKIADNLLNIDKWILFEAQLRTKALKSFLDVLADRSLEGDVNIETSNFNFYSLYEEADLAISVVDSNTKIIKNFDTTMNDFDNAAILMPIGHYLFRVTLSVFFKNNFFFNSSIFYEDFGSVFGFFHPLEDANTSLTLIHRIKNKVVNEICLSWNIDQNIWEETEPNRTELFIICKFQKSGYFTIGFIKDDITDELINLLESNASALVKVSQLSYISENYDRFKPVDIMYASRILEEATTADDVDLHSLAKFVSNMQKIQRGVLNESQIIDKATDRILFSIDKIIYNNRRYKNSLTIITDNFGILKINLSQIHFTGVLLKEKHQKINIQILEGNDSIDFNQEFDSVLTLSPMLKEQLELESEIIVTIFSNDSLFNEQNAIANTVDAVFGVILPEFGNYSGPVSIIHKVKTHKLQSECVYWHYNSSASSYWQKDGVNNFLEDLVQCDYWHTTHFALLLIPRHRFSDKTDFLIFEVITTTNNVLSIVSLCFIILTAVLFKQWRSNTGNQILLNFVVVLLLHSIVFYISTSVARLDNHALCTSVGFLLQYFTISEFCWMLVIAILQYRRFVIVFDRPLSHILVKACVCGWILPLIPAISVLSFDTNSYVRNAVDMCYPSGQSLYLGIWLPISVIIIINCTLFLIIFYNIVYNRTKCVRNSNETMYQLRLAILLFFMFGLTWLFGLLSNFDADTTFLYLFTITGTLQGVVLFLFFIVFNHGTRALYIRIFEKYFCKIN